MHQHLLNNYQTFKYTTQLRKQTIIILILSADNPSADIFLSRLTQKQARLIIIISILIQEHASEIQKESSEIQKESSEIQKESSKI